jgi:hypothetical protein
MLIFEEFKENVEVCGFQSKFTVDYFEDEKISELS